MSADPPAQADSKPKVAAALSALLLAVAYSGLLLPDPLIRDLSTVLFRPSAIPSLGLVAVAAFVAWILCADLKELPSNGSPTAAALLGIAGMLLFGWAHLCAAGHLLLPALALHGLAFAALARGLSGAWRFLPAALILLVGTPFPKPLEDEILWQLQQGTAVWSGWLLIGLGLPFTQQGVMLHGEDHTFHVIDGCSGFSGIVILTLVALVVRELFGARGWRGLVLVALAPLLGFVLNVVRIAYVASSPNPEALAGQEGDHTVQGLLVLMLGTAVLYGAGWSLASEKSDRSRPAQPSVWLRRPRWFVCAGAAAALAGLHLGLPVFPQTQPPPVPSLPEIPMKHRGWVGQLYDGDSLEFDGVLVGLQRHYRLDPAPGRPAQIVDILISYEHPNNAESFRLLSSKLSFPGPDWELLLQAHETLWTLDLPITTSRLRQGTRYSHSYVWRVGDRGMLRESLRSWFALDRSPFRRSAPRAAVRLVAYAPHDGSLALDRSRQRLERFVTDFREWLDQVTRP